MLKLKDVLNGKYERGYHNSATVYCELINDNKLLTEEFMDYFIFFKNTKKYKEILYHFINTLNDVIEHNWIDTEVSETIIEYFLEYAIKEKDIILIEELLLCIESNTKEFLYLIQNLNFSNISNMLEIYRKQIIEEELND